MLKDKVALVVGGSSGFGRAIAERFAGEGAKVVVAARRLELCEEIAKTIGGSAVRCDVSSDDDVRSTVDAALEEHGRLDVAVNSAGYEHLVPIRDLEAADLQALASVQLFGALYFIRRVGNAMEARSGGSIVTISSLTAQRPGEGVGAYAACKKAVEYASQVAALEYGPKQVRVNCVAASLIETPMTARLMNPVVTRAFVEQTPLGRMGEIPDIVEAALWLASDASSYVTGQTLCVDGGNSLTRLPSAQNFMDAARREAESSDD